MSLHLPEQLRGAGTHRAEHGVGRRVGACPAAVFSSEVEQLREQLAEALVEAEQQRIRAEAAEAELRELRASLELTPFPADFVPSGYIRSNNRGGVAETLPGTPSASDAAAIPPSTAARHGGCSLGSDAAPGGARGAAGDLPAEPQR